RRRSSLSSSTRSMPQGASPTARSFPPHRRPLENREIRPPHLGLRAQAHGLPRPMLRIRRAYPVPGVADMRNETVSIPPLIAAIVFVVLFMAFQLWLMVHSSY